MAPRKDFSRVPLGTEVGKLTSSHGQAAYNQNKTSALAFPWALLATALRCAWPPAVWRTLAPPGTARKLTGAWGFWLLTPVGFFYSMGISAHGAMGMRHAHVRC